MYVTEEFLMKNKRWILNRAGLFNFWYYDYQEYHFKDGHLLLRGGNGSGKSVTMQSLLTFLLDGNKQPSRLDPFGSKDRKMRDYLLGEKHINNVENRIGYLFIEYKLEGSEQYITTGYGLEAKKDTNVLKDWGFVIFNRFSRIHKGLNEIKLYKTELINGKEEKIPLSESEFKKAIGNNGVVCGSREEYVMNVNKHLFGFSEHKKLEQFTELVAKLKSPKLSKSFKPTVVGELLLDSLPELSDEELTPLTDTISAIDQIENDIKKTNSDIQSLRKITKIYDTYNELILLEKAYNYLESKKKLANELKFKKTSEKELNELQNQKSDIETQITKLIAEQEAKEEEKMSLGLGEIGNLKDEQNKVLMKLKELEKSIENKNAIYDAKKSSMTKLESKIDSLEAEMESSKRDVEDFLMDIHNLSEEIKFELHNGFVSQFKRNYESGTYEGLSLWKEETKKYQVFVQQIRQLLTKHEELEKQQEKTKLEIADTELNIDEQEKIARQLDNVYEQVRAELFEEIEEWIQHVQEFHVGEELKQKLGKLIQGLLEGVREDEFRVPIEELFQNQKSDIVEVQISHNLKVKEIEKEVNRINKEIGDLKNQKELEPSWDEKETVLASIQEKGIPYLPFYAAVEFKDEVSEEIRSALESAFSESGLLKALIVSDNYRSKVQEEITVAEKGSVKTHSLLKYLVATPENAITKEEIESVLASISVVENEEGYILENGSFKQSFVSGNNKTYGTAKYVGKVARKQLKEKKILELEAQLNELKEELQNNQEVVTETRNRLQTLEQEYKQFPKIVALKEAKIAFENKQTEIQNIYKVRLNNLNETLKETKHLISQSKGKIKGQMNLSELDVSLTVFEKAYTDTTEYLMALSDLETTYNGYKSAMNSISNYTNQKASLEEDIDVVNDDLYSLTKEQAIQQSRYESIEKQLEAHQAKEIEKRYETIISRLKEIPNEIDSLKDKRRDTDGEINKAANDIQVSEKKIVFLENKTEVWKNIFSNEYSLKLIQIEIENDNEQESLDEIAKEVRNHLKEVHQTKNQDNIDELKINVTKRIEKAFNDQQAYLAEYNLTKYLENDEFVLDAQNELEEQEVRNIKNICQRQKIELEYEYTMRTPNVVMGKWEEHLLHQESVLTAKERKLFEETIIETIGDSIKNRIQHATYWVKEMNRFMEEQSNSNGLGFKISWSQKDEEDSKDSKKNKDSKETSVMKLLQKDVNVLSENDRRKISKFFKDKVNDAKRNIEKDVQMTLFVAVKEALDYRRWYQFNIMYKKGDTNNQFVPLTNTKFNKFSGGEKALSMYVPLLSAVHSRLQEASPEAPRIIALDEAFAGVDDNNINEMFHLVENLDFDYIMNSQALWGCYEKVSSLSIYEIIRPQDAPFVGTAQYEWDGKDKTFVTQEFSLEETNKMEEEGLISERD